MPNEPWQSPETQPTTEPTQSPGPLSVQPVTPAVESAPQPVAEAISAPTSAAAPVPAGDSVWVSKEEYERLRQAEVQQQARPEAKQKGPVDVILIVALAIAALIFIVSLMGGQFSYWTAFAFALLAMTGLFTMYDYTQAKRTGIIREHKARNVILLVVTIGVVALPMIGMLVLMLMFMAACGTSGCRGS